MNFAFVQGVPTWSKHQLFEDSKVIIPQRMRLEFYFFFSAKKIQQIERGFETQTNFHELSPFVRDFWLDSLDSWRKLVGARLPQPVSSGNSNFKDLPWLGFTFLIPAPRCWMFELVWIRFGCFSCCWCCLLIVRWQLSSETSVHAGMALNLFAQLSICLQSQFQSVWPDGAIFSPCGYFWPLRGAKILAGGK